MLANGEVCHYCGPATFVKTKNVVVGYSGGSRGTSVRIAKGMSVHLGARKAAPIRGDVQERTQGVLSITNKRVVFSANKGAFDKKISALSAVTPYQNGIAFQFGDQQYPWKPASRNIFIRYWLVWLIHPRTSNASIQIHSQKW